MRSRLLLLILASAGVAATSGCAADVTMPAAPAAIAAPAPAAASGEHLDLSADGARVSLGSGDTVTYLFTIDPRAVNELRMGAHSLLLPAAAVCAWDAREYAAALWDAPCTPETRPVTITARVTGRAAGYPRVDFQPAMRFNPRTTVYLSLFLKPTRASGPLDWRILYCATASRLGCIDEALFDPSLVTQFNPPANLVARRIKHFSGYMVAE